MQINNTTRTIAPDKHTPAANLNSGMLPESQELLHLLQNPNDHYMNHVFGKMRNPDVIYIHISKAGSIVIDGVGEIKLGHLNERAINQFEYFIYTVRHMCQILNTPEYRNLNRLRSMGLNSIAARNWSIDSQTPLINISKNFKEYLIVPANRHIKRKPAESMDEYKNRMFLELVDNRLHHDNNMRERFYIVLDHIEIRQSAFSVEEVSAISGYVLDKIMDLEKAHQMPQYTS